MENTQLPPEIEDLRDQAETAAANLAMAEGAADAAAVELKAARDKADAAMNAVDDAGKAEEQARREYIAALRRHGYVQTADGPRPAHTVHS